LVGFAKLKDELNALGVKVFAASVDPEDKAKLVADEVNFPVGYGVVRAQADLMGSWWEERRQIIQPSEFIVSAERKIMASSYSDGPVGRVEAVGDFLRSPKEVGGPRWEADSREVPDTVLRGTAANRNLCRSVGDARAVICHQEPTVTALNKHLRQVNRVILQRARLARPLN
jgi:AhpC/TSA family